MDAVFGKAFAAALVVAVVMMVIYQIVMLVWTKRTTGSIPTAIMVLRGINIAVLLAIGVLVLVNSVGR